MDRFDELLAIAEKWASCGERLLPNGSRLICPTPHVAPEAWFHQIYWPAAEAEILKGEKDCLLPRGLAVRVIRWSAVTADRLHIASKQNQTGSEALPGSRGPGMPPVLASLPPHSKYPSYSTDLPLATSQLVDLYSVEPVVFDQKRMQQVPRLKSIESIVGNWIHR
ncbi:MAG TPA: hypothetical protein VJX67_04715 [Blastocatellia bacterium]|nr:hypothetical protein [Blastocatellia bacterium]